jgi:hypothetical protein
MPSQAYAFEEGGPKRLTVDWTKRWRFIDLYLDGEKTHTVEGQTLFGRGQDFPLPDGSTLHLKLARGWTDCELYVMRDGQPLPGSTANAESRLQIACLAIWLIAGLNIVLGWIAWAFQIEFLQSLGQGFLSILFGVGFLVLGQFAGRGSLAALLIALALYGLDSILSWVSSESSGLSFFRLGLLGAMAQGIGATWTVRMRGKGIAAHLGQRPLAHPRLSSRRPSARLGLPVADLGCESAGRP